MNIHFFTFSDEKGGSSRQRAFRVVTELQARGISAVVHWPPTLLMSKTPWPGKFALIVATIHSLFQIKKEDIVYLQRTISSKYFFSIMVVYLFIFRRKIIFDFDDPVYVHTYFKTKVFCKMANAVIVCTHGQEKWALQFNPNVYIFHIALDFPAYRKFTKDYTSEQSPLILGWVGNGPEHIEHLALLVPVFKELLKTETVRPFTFLLIGALKDKNVHALFKDIPDLSVEFIDSLDWTDPESVPREIQKFDIGIMPHLSDGEWNKSKTAFKHLEYMACGVATMVSAFGEIPYIFRDGVNGYMASNTDEWVSKLQNLLSDKELRTELGLAGQKTVQEGYCYDVMIPRLIELINSLAESTIP